MASGGRASGGRTDGARPRRTNGFTTIRSAGGLLPGDLLSRVHAHDRDLEGMHPEDYHLAPGEKLGDAITRSWNRLLGAWAAFTEARAKLPDGDAATGLTRSRWSLLLFQELGYGQLQPTRPIEIDDKPYPVSHLWGAVPIHLVGAGVSIDKRAPGVTGAAQRAPHSLVQELLNRSHDFLWGMVCNGDQLRVLRDNATLTRQAYLEFDLAGMMDGQQYADFTALWLIAHQSRLEGEVPAKCLLERWKDETDERGVPALKRLRLAVETAIKTLGSGFLAHRDNGALRQALADGDLSRQDYYRELLRLVYRVLFVLVAESRDLLLVPDADAVAKARYRDYYSLDRVRRLADARRGGPHGDLWRQLRVVFGGLGRPDGIPELALPGLGSMLWSPAATPHLDAAHLTNVDLLGALRALSTVTDGGVRRHIDYRSLQSEELGSVYESLLELHPEVSPNRRAFDLRAAPGNERKTSGSYYTPTSLVDQLLDTALDPVLDAAVRSAGSGSVAEAEAAILGLTVLDPACGSGHFLVAAAQRIAKRLAAVRSGDDEPSPGELQHALREVVSRCIHGIDVNEMAVELCKVSLWLEAMEPGRPLSFLDHRIVHGNSLLGTTPRLLAEGIPDAAYKPLTGDERDFAAARRKQNKQERGDLTDSFGQESLLFTATPADLQHTIATGYTAIDRLPDTSLDDVTAKEQQWAELQRSREYARMQLAADAWCTAFVCPKRKGDPVPTSAFVRQALANDASELDPAIVAAVDQAQSEYRFLHLHLAFPDVFRVPTDGQSPDNTKTGWSSGFDVVLGNPPWERVKLQEKEFFAQRSPEIAAAPNAAARKKLIAALADADPNSSDPTESTRADLHRQFTEAAHHAEGESTLLRDSDRYPLAGRGDVNTYAVFAETMRDALSGTGRMGVIVPLGIATDDTMKFFFGDLVERRSLVSLYGFENEEHLFPEVDHRVTFGLLTLAGNRTDASDADLCFFARQVAALDEPDRRFTLSADDFRLLNPNTRTCPIFRNLRDAELTKGIYRRVPVLEEVGAPDGNPWNVTLWTMFHMSGDSNLFRTRAQLERDGWTLRGNLFERNGELHLPLYEAKMLSFFDHRFGTYDGQTEAQANQGILPRLRTDQQRDPSCLALPRYWVPGDVVNSRMLTERHPVLGWREVARSTDSRTVITAAGPAVGYGHKFPLVTGTESHLLGAIWSSFVFDYVARQKLGGTSMSNFIVKQLPNPYRPSFNHPPPWDASRSFVEWITSRVLELIYTAWDMEAFGRHVGYVGPPFRWDDERRPLLRAELDACFFHVYGIERDDVEYVMSGFHRVRANDEKVHGEYRTKRLILECYDAMADASRTGATYATRLTPPPADPTVAHPASTRPDWVDLLLPPEDDA